MKRYIPALIALLFAMPAPAQEHQSHDHGAPSKEGELDQEPAPPTDHAADQFFDPKIMAAARAASQAEHGGAVYSLIRVELAEYQVGNADDGYRWKAEAWYGGDIHRLVLKTEGEGKVRGTAEDVELQALYSRAIGPYFNIQAGVRSDFKPNPTRGYATLGMEGLAPYYIETEAALFLSDQGDLLGRIELSYDQLVTQRFVLQPRIEVNVAAADIPERGVGSGISDVELGLRLRYEIMPEFAPYIGVSYHRKTGDTARMARAAGEPVGGPALVLGIRTWF